MLPGEISFFAWRALRPYFGVSFDGTEVAPGAVGFLQTAGELLNFHPHVHILVTDGGFRPDRGFRHLPRFNSRHLERLFRGEVLRMLVDKTIIDEEIVRSLLAWRHSGFSVHGGAAASSAASLWAGTRLRHRLRHRPGDPAESEAASPGARTSGP